MSANSNIISDNNNNNDTSDLIVAQLVGLVSAAIIFVASLGWNEAAKCFFEHYSDRSDKLIGKIMYAITVTVVAVIILIFLVFLIDRCESSNNNNNDEEIIV